MGTATESYNIPEMNKYLDLINLMTYDMHGHWESKINFNSPLYASAEDEKLWKYPVSCQWVVDYWISQGASPSKLTLGFATYGRGWKLKNPAIHTPNTEGNGPAPKSEVGEMGYAPYWEIARMIKNGGKRYWDDVRKVPYVVYNDIWYGYDDEESIKLKVEFLKSRKLVGGMVWALDLDDFQGKFASDGKPFPLIRTITEGLKGYSPTPNSKSGCNNDSECDVGEYCTHFNTCMKYALVNETCNGSI